ncbi:MAG: molybdopterin-dependent oxidoreductase [Rhodospirillales bacterium]|nr:molybdopterin-dependent oxidoreductase [Rhodospirillales bacterium]
MGIRIERIARILAAVAVVFTLQVTPGSASGSLEKPVGPVILTVEGKIKITNTGKEARFDRKMLDALGMHTLKTSNPFDTGTHTYEGVLLSDLLESVGADGTMLVAYALDGYAVEIPVADTKKYPVMLAMIWNGKEMTVRNKGPIWVIYPIDKYTELKDEKYSSRSIWQLERLIVE